MSSKISKKMATISMVVLLGINGFLAYKVVEVENQYDEIKKEVQESRHANEQVLSMLHDIRNEQNRQAQAMQIAYRKKVQQQKEKNNVMLLKANGFGVYTDLGQNIEISVEDMDRIIDYYAAHAVHGTSFKGKGQVFVDAGKETGLNPIYIFAHACIESDYGMSYLGRTRNNYFGINAVDNDPGLAYSMGDSVDEGIRAGAKWIKKNFYNNGYTTLESMHQAGYATDPDWANDINTMVNNCISLI